MKRLMTTVAALALLTTTAQAYEVTCGAPRMLFTTDNSPDTNPVIGVEVRYEPQDHQWRVFHTLRDGRVVSRSEQYSMTDASTDTYAQWQGSHGKMRHLFMIGEVKRGPNGIEYHEWQYNRNTNTMLMESKTLCRNVAAPVVAQTERPIVMEAPQRAPMPVPQRQQQAASVLYFQVPYDVSAGKLNVRSGPGANYDLLGVYPGRRASHRHPLRSARGRHCRCRLVPRLVSRADRLGIRVGLMPL